MNMIQAKYFKSMQGLLVVYMRYHRSATPISGGERERAPRPRPIFFFPATKESLPFSSSALFSENWGIFELNTHFPLEFSIADPGNQLRSF